MELEKEYYKSPRWSGELADCSMPMTFDTYSNCAFQCVYCFSFFQRALGVVADGYLSHKVKAVNVDKVKRMFLDPDQYGGGFKEYIKRRYVMQWGGLSDGFDWYERKFRKSLELLRFFREIDYPISISTKGTWFLDDPEYVELLRDAKNVHVKISIITADKAKAAKLEAGVSTPAERFEALEKLNKLGVASTTLRLRPFIIGVSEHTDRELVSAADAAGCYSVTTEFLCIEKRAKPITLERYKAISAVCGFDLWEFYKKHSYSGSGLLRLNYSIKRPFIQRLKYLCAEYGLEFFVSDAHHKQECAAICCCGFNPTGAFKEFNRGQFTTAILLAKAYGSVRFSDIEPYMEWLDGIGFRDIEGFNKGDTLFRAKWMYGSIKDYLRYLWNTPTSWKSPARYFGGVLVPAGVDDNGDIVYLYNKPLAESGKVVASVQELRDS